MSKQYKVRSFFDLNYVMVFGWLPIIVKYVDELPLAGMVKILIFPYILIEHRYRHDYGLLVHEITHVKDFFRDFPTYYFCYKNVETYRLKAECKAYAAQYWENPSQQAYELFLSFLQSDYEFEYGDNLIANVFADHVRKAIPKKSIFPFS